MHIVASSFNPPEDNVRWVEEQACELEIWSDEDKELALGYGAADSPSAIVPSRITRVLHRAAEVLVAHWDGYAGNLNNTYLYADPSDGRFRFVPWGVVPGQPVSGWFTATLIRPPS